MRCDQNGVWGMGRPLLPTRSLQFPRGPIGAATSMWQTVLLQALIRTEVDGMGRYLRFLLLAATTMAAAVFVPVASSQPTKDEQTQFSVLLGTTLAILFHELGHALVGELQVPATGPEEDVADGFSAIAMSVGLEERMDASLSQGILRYASLLWYHMALRPGTRGSWQDEHAPDIRRFYNSFCLIYGSAPSYFERLADDVKFETRVRQRCIREYHRRRLAWETILRPVSRDSVDEAAGDHPADDSISKVVVTVSPASTRFGRIVETLFAEDGLGAEFGRMLEQQIAWPRDLTVEFRDCDLMNAWYDPREGKVTICYSIIEYATNLVLEEEGISPTLTSRMSAVDRYPKGVAYLVGTWVAHLPTERGLVTATTSYAADHTFRLETAGLEIVGRWDVEHVGGDMLRFHAEPTDWSPREILDEHGSRQPVVQEPQRNLVRMLDANTVDSDGVIWRRRSEATVSDDTP